MGKRIFSKDNNDGNRTRAGFFVEVSRARARAPEDARAFLLIPLPPYTRLCFLPGGFKRRASGVLYENEALCACRSFPGSVYYGTPSLFPRAKLACVRVHESDARLLQSLCAEEISREIWRIRKRVNLLLCYLKNMFLGKVKNYNVKQNYIRDPTFKSNEAEH